MTDVFDRIKAANPVPDPDRYYESVVGEGRQLLGSIRDRRNHMTVDEITRLEMPQDPPPQSSFRGWKVAVAAAAAAVSLVVGFVVVGGGGDDVAALTDVQTAEQFVALFESGDVAGYEALLSADAEMGGGPFSGPPATIWAYVSRYQGVAGGTYSAQCSETPASPTVDVACEMSESNAFREAARFNPRTYNWTFAIDGGTITVLRVGGDSSGGHVIPEFGQIAEYDAWLQANYPAERDALMAVPVEVYDLLGWPGDRIPLPIVDNAAASTRNAELISEWTASLP